MIKNQNEGLKGLGDYCKNIVHMSMENDLVRITVLDANIFYDQAIRKIFTTIRYFSLFYPDRRIELDLERVRIMIPTMIKALFELQKVEGDEKLTIVNNRSVAAELKWLKEKKETPPKNADKRATPVASLPHSQLQTA